jgi:hypothetical protein
MRHMRRIAISIFGVVSVMAMALNAAPSAFAMRVLPVSGGEPGPAVSSGPHRPGLSAWQISVFVVAGTLLLVALFTDVVWLSRRSRLARLRTAV